MNFFKANYKKLLLVIGLVAPVTILLVCKETVKDVSQHDKDIQELINLVANVDTQRKQLEALFENIPQVSKEYVRKLSNKLVEKFNTPEIKKEQAEIIKKYLNETDVKEILKFYNTATGKKMLENMPKLMGEFSQIGIKVAMEIEKEIAQEQVKEAELKNNNK